VIFHPPKPQVPGGIPRWRQENLTACAGIKPQSFAPANRNLHTPFRKPLGRRPNLAVGTLPRARHLTGTRSRPGALET
jgi:hypothetical protein